MFHNHLWRYFSGYIGLHPLHLHVHNKEVLVNSLVQGKTRKIAKV